MAVAHLTGVPDVIGLWAKLLDEKGTPWGHICRGFAQVASSSLRLIAYV